MNASGPDFEAQPSKLVLILSVGVLAVLIWSGISPKDRFTWILEVCPVVIAALILVPTRRTFPLTNLVYFLIAVHAIILCVGGRYTYAEVPLFNWIRDAFHLSRNHYDRVGHFAQGFVPAMVAREILIRKNVILKRGWLFFIVCCICLAISAVYELIEWSAAVLSGTAADAFLGTQGDVWDSQKDMLLALIGSSLAQLLLNRFHDRSLQSAKP